MAQTGTNMVNVPGDKHEFDPEHWVSSTNAATTNGTTNGNGTATLPDRHPNTAIDVLVVGGGVGGLMTALECWRKGHNVVGILERNEGPVYSGDIIAIQPSVISILRHWPDMWRELEEEQVHVSLNYETHKGEHIYGPSVPSFNDPEHVVGRKGPTVAPAQIRRKFFRMLLRQVARLGLRVDYGKPVREYFEDASAGKGGVVLESGEIRIADIVVAADGLRSRSEILIAGKHAKTRSSGMSIYRTSYPRALAMEDPTVRERWGNVPSSWEFWLGPGMYMGVFLSPDIVSWGFTPLEAEGEATESWEPDADPESVVRSMLRAPDWHPAVPALVRTAPKGAVVHWPLLWRNLQREWTSAGGRVVQVGDSAHTFTPTSGNGATQALEDAITLATCLQLGGSANKGSLATKIYNLLRYERVSCAQKMSFVNAQLKTETDWDLIWKNPVMVRTRFPRWIFSHDPEAYAYQKYGEAFAHIVSGAEFVNTNLPPGHKFVPWTIEEVYQDIEAGKKVEDLLDGDWS